MTAYFSLGPGPHRAPRNPFDQRCIESGPPDRFLCQFKARTRPRITEVIEPVLPGYYNFEDFSARIDCVGRRTQLVGSDEMFLSGTHARNGLAHEVVFARTKQNRHSEYPMLWITLNRTLCVKFSMAVNTNGVSDVTLNVRRPLLPIKYCVGRNMHKPCTCYNGSIDKVSCSLHVDQLRFVRVRFAVIDIGQRCSMHDQLRS